MTFTERASQKDTFVEDTLGKLLEQPLDSWKRVRRHSETIGNNVFSVQGFQIQIENQPQVVEFDHLMLNKYFGKLYTGVGSEHFRIKITDINSELPTKVRYVDPWSGATRSARELKTRLLISNVKLRSARA